MRCSPSSKKGLRGYRTYRIWGSGLRLRYPDLGFRDSGIGYWIWGSGLRGLGFRVPRDET